MKFTFNWLKEFVSVTLPAEKLAERLTMAGLEVESLARLREPETNQEDWLFEIAVTPNRGDCLGISGLARELAALTVTQLNSLPVSLHAEDPAGMKRLSVVIEAPELCSRYSASVIHDLSVQPSLPLMKFRLEACGIRAINNVVDITNYVMLETGQPLHAFDLERLSANRIVVRTAQGIKTFTTLDGVERELAREDLLICDGARPIALAGVMGGADSEVTAQTRRILLESANFDPVAIRRTTRRLGLHSEASHRFERGVDPGGTVAALDRAVYLLVKIARGNPVKVVADSYPRPPKLPTIALRNEHIEGLLGIRLAGKETAKLLKSLGLEVEAENNGVIKVQPPSSRPDLTREADLIEEIARLYGYEKIPSTLPRVLCSGGKSDYRLAEERRLRTFLAGEGFVEVINLPFASERTNRRFTGVWQGAAAPVTVLNPLVQESAEMRFSLVPGLIENLNINLAQKAESFHAYHLGKVFRLASGGESEERQSLAGILFGPRQQLGLRAGEEKSPTFLHCKGIVEGILDLLHIADKLAWSAETPRILHPGRAAALLRDGSTMGYLGQIHPDLQQQLGVPPFFLFELDFEELLQYAPRRIKTRSLPRFPSVERDFAIVVDERFPSGQIVSWIESLGEALIEQVQVFDHYAGSPIPQGKKSLAYKISYRADDRTLTDTEVNTLHQDLTNRIEKLFGAQLRS
ncbi:MAG TPA: phenylalanine--tRNA ligase subunit beta [Candidatus Binatia bacterium]|nr:phenylalanine--tRNA ligase subunit beta [Candidatus Binatia bacterium]